MTYVDAIVSWFVMHSVLATAAECPGGSVYTGCALPFGSCHAQSFLQSERYSDDICVEGCQCLYGKVFGEYARGL